MKFGESSFDLLYLIFAITSGIIILRRAGNRTEKQMGLAALILGCGDAFHLVPRVLNYFVSADFTAALGIGKLVTSVTMTVFYVLLYTIWLGYFRVQEKRSVTMTVYALAALRILLCLFPQNGWLENSGSLLWGILRNIPFTALGAVVCALYFQQKAEDRTFRYVWLYILLSFLFYIPVVVGTEAVPMLGMLMLPKTICYVLLIVVFLRATRHAQSKETEGASYHDHQGSQVQKRRFLFPALCLRRRRGHGCI